jgi:hypothetical protein
MAFRPWLYQQIIAGKPSRKRASAIDPDDIAVIREYAEHHGIAIGLQKPQPLKSFRSDPRNWGCFGTEDGRTSSARLSTFDSSTDERTE